MNSPPPASLESVRRYLELVVSDPSIDPERMSAFLDGRLDARAREALIAELSRDPELLELYADAIAGVRAAEPPVALVADSAPKTSLPWRRLAIAAAVVVAVAIPVLQQRGGDTVRDPSAFVAALTAPSAGLTTDWDGAPWSTMRGAASTTANASRAIRLGARLVDLEVAVRAKSEGATLVARDASTLLDGFAASGPVVARLAAVSAATAPDTVVAIAHDAAAIASPEATARGALIETARIAAAAGDRAFFDTEPWLTGMRALPTDTPERTKLVNTIRATSAHGNNPMGTYLALTDLLRDLAG